MKRIIGNLFVQSAISLKVLLVDAASFTVSSVLGYFLTALFPLMMLSTVIQRVRDLGDRKGISSDALLKEIIDRY